MTNDSARRVFAVIPDLFFATKVAATARAAASRSSSRNHAAAVARAQIRSPRS